MNVKEFHSSFVTGMKIRESFGRYELLCKAGDICAFGFEQISNQVHIHDCYELCVITSGSGKFIHNDEEFFIKEGDVIIADKGVPHEVQSVNMQDMRLLYIFIEISVNNSLVLTKTMEDNLIHGFMTKHYPVASSFHYILLYLDFIENYNMQKPGRHFGTYQALKNLVLESLAALSSNVPLLNTQVASQNSLERALDYIDANLHKKISVMDIVTETHVSQRNLEYLFKKKLGSTIIGYVNERKVHRACHYLEMCFNISDTGRLVGVPDLIQFSRLFSKHKGMSPSKYQMMHGTGKNQVGRIGCRV